MFYFFWKRRGVEEEKWKELKTAVITYEEAKKINIFLRNAYPDKLFYFKWRY